MTRDSAMWWAMLVLASAAFLSAHFDLVTKAFPAVSAVWESRLGLLSAFVGMLAGYLRMSPLRLSPDSELTGQGADPSKTLTIVGKQAPTTPTP